MGQVHPCPLSSMDVCKLVGKNIRRLRQDKDWSQERLVDETGLHRTYISGIERGVRNPTVTIITKLAEQLDVKPEDILKN